MLNKLRAARAANKAPVAPVPTPTPPAGPATVESLGQQLREVLPTRRLQSVSLCDHEANVLWLSEGALGPDEHMLVMESLEILKADSSLPCHETALEDGRLGVFLPVRAPTGALVGVAMILADSKSVGDDTLERMTAAPVRTIMQRLAVLLKPSGLLGSAPIPVDLPEEIEEAVAEAPEEPEPVEVEAAAAPADVGLELVSEVEVDLPPAQDEPETDDDTSDTIISAAEIASILELELEPEPPPAASAAKPAVAPAPAAAPPVVPVAPPADESAVADSGMLRLEFLAEPPVVRPAQNPSAVARKLQAASKAAEVAPTRAPRALPAPPPPRPNTAPAIPAAPAKGKAPPVAPAAKATAPAPAAARPAQPAAPAPAASSAATSASGRHPFEPVPPHSRLSLHASDEDVVVLFESEPVSVPVRPAAPAKAPPAAAPKAVAAPARPAPPKPAPPRIQPAVRTAPPARTAPAVRNIPPAPAPAAAPAPRVLPPAAPVAAPAPAPVAAPVVIPVVAAAPVQLPAPAASRESEAAPAIDLVPFARLRAGGQNRRFQVQPRGAAAQRDAAADEQMIQELLAWLGSHRAQWNSAPTTFTVNLSIATLEDERFLTKIGAALNTHGISGETLGFEIAETLCAQQRAKVERFIAQCEKIGAWVAIDDFSFDSQVLPLLRSKALRLLKLDARLTAAALRDKLSQAMLVATVQAAKVLGIHTSAKKADSQASLQYLTAIGLDYAQGAALARPVPLEGIGTATESRAPDETE